MDFNELNSYILDSVNYGVYFVDVNRRIMLWNRKAEEVTGYSREEVIGTYCYDNLLKHIDSNATPLCLTSCPVHQTILDGQFREMGVFLRHKEGHRISVKVQSSPVYQAGTILGVVETFEMQEAEVYSDDLVDSLTKLVMTDKLTGLFNRRHGEHAIENKLNTARFSNNFVGILFMDIDNFSMCNNTYGHDVGDLVLQTVTSDISKQIRSTDLFCRWGGEEFLGIFDLSYAGEVAVIGEKIRQIVENALIMSGETKISVTASLGATVLQPGDTIDSVVARADSLMYESKHKGKNRVTVG